MSETERTAAEVTLRRDAIEVMLEAAEWADARIVRKAWTDKTPLRLAVINLRAALAAADRLAADRRSAVDTVAAEMRAIVDDAYDPDDDWIVAVELGQLRRWIARLTGEESA